VSLGEKPSSVDELFAVFEEHGTRQYYGEPITLLAHSLQAAQMGSRAGAIQALIAAALLHDVGHRLFGGGEDFSLGGVDDEHELLGAEWLGGLFGAEVCEPIRRHVDTKLAVSADRGRSWDEVAAPSFDEGTERPDGKPAGVRFAGRAGGAGT
jgi:predicted HD phosphohydrolase